LKIVLLALFGLVAGQAVVWYSGQFYALFFLTSVLKVDGSTANLLVAASLVIGTPFFVVFGTLSDKIGRKPIILAGLLLAVVTYFPIFGALTTAANPDLAKAQQTAKTVKDSNQIKQIHTAMVSRANETKGGKLPTPGLINRRAAGATPATDRRFCALNSRTKLSMSSGRSSLRSRSGGNWMPTTFSR
jgi:hypothetical protein